MNRRLSPRQHAAASLSILVLLLLAVYLGVIEPALKSRGEFRDRFEELQFQHARLNHSIERMQSLRSEIGRLKKTQPDQGGFLEEKPDALAAADLQNTIKDLVSNSGGNLISTQVVMNQGKEIFPDIKLKVHMRGTINAMQKLFFDLGNNQPVLLMDNVLIQSRNTGTRRVRPDVDQLEIRFDVTAYVYKSETS